MAVTKGDAENLLGVGVRWVGSHQHNPWAELTLLSEQDVDVQSPSGSQSGEGKGFRAWCEPAERKGILTEMG